MERANDGVPHLGAGDLPDDRNTARTGLRPLQQQDALQSTPSTPTTRSSHRACKRSRTCKQGLLQQGPPRGRLGRVRQLHSRDEAGSPIRPKPCRRAGPTRYFDEGDCGGLPRTVDQVPCRDREPSPQTTASTANEEDDYYDLALGGLWGGQDPPYYDELPGHLRDSRWSGPLWGLRWGEGDPHGRIFRPGPDYQGDEQISGWFQDTNTEQVLEQDPSLGEGIHNQQCSPGDFLFDGTSRTADCLLPQDLFHY